MFSNSMDGTTLPGLPSLDEAPVSMQDSELPELHPGFFIPRLTDKPQNPIMDTISLVQRARDSAYTPHSLPVEVEALAEDMWAVAKARQRIESDLWQQVAQEKTSDRVGSFAGLQKRNAKLLTALIASPDVMGNLAKLLQRAYHPTCVSVAAEHPCVRLRASLVRKYILFFSNINSCASVLDLAFTTLPGRWCMYPAKSCYSHCT